VDNSQLLDAMKKAVEADPTQPAVLNRYAMALCDAGRFTEAEEWFAKAVALAPNDVDVRSMYGAALWRMGKKEEAEVQLEAALKLEPASIPSLHGLTLLALEKRDAARAERFIKQLESAEPTYDQLPELRNRLKGLQGGN
jgi:Flp pilus assembly protein TadD